MLRKEILEIPKIQIYEIIKVDFHSDSFESKNIALIFE